MVVDGYADRRAGKSSPKALSFSMESRVMRNLLQVDFLGLLHINAEGIVAITAAVLIVIAVLLGSRLGKS